MRLMPVVMVLLNHWGCNEANACSDGLSQSSCLVIILFNPTFASEWPGKQDLLLKITDLDPAAVQSVITQGCTYGGICVGLNYYKNWVYALANVCLHMIALYCLSEFQ